MKFVQAAQGGKGRHMRWTTALLISLFAATISVATAEPDKAVQGAVKKASSEGEIQEKMKEAIVAFRAGMTAEDEAARVKTLTEVLPDRELVQKLFGRENGEALWGTLSERVEQMKTHTAELKKEFESRGSVKETKLINIRQGDDKRSPQDLLKIIPQDIPVYRAVFTYETGSSGASSFLLVDGKLRWFRGLEEMPKVIKMIQERTAAEKDK